MPAYRERMHERPILLTPRLRLRPFRPDDAAWLHDLWAERDPRFPRRLDAQGRPTVDDLRRELEERQEATGPTLLVAERSADGAVIGYCGLVAGRSSASEPELAFELLRAMHGQGFATEAARAVLEHEQDRHPRLWATVRDWNAPSLRVLAKLGFVRSGRVDADRERGDVVWLVREPAPL